MFVPTSSRSINLDTFRFQVRRQRDAETLKTLLYIIRSSVRHTCAGYSTENSGTEGTIKPYDDCAWPWGVGPTPSLSVCVGAFRKLSLSLNQQRTLRG